MAATKSKAKTAAKKAQPSAKKAKAATASKAKKRGTAASKKAVSKPKAAAKAGAKAQAPKATKAKATKDVLDFGEFPAGSVTRHEVTLCLSCIFKLFTNQLGLAPRTAYNEIRRYAPTAEALARAARRLPRRGRQGFRRRAQGARQKASDEGRTVPHHRREEDGAAGL